MIEDDNDLAGYWNDLSPLAKPVQRGGLHAMDESLRAAAKQTVDELKILFLQNHTGKRTDNSDTFALLITEGVEAFIRNWYAIICTKDMTALLAIVLTAQDLSAENLKGFIRALPMSILDKVAQSGCLVPQANGVHALIGVESVWRQGHMPRDYLLEKREGRIHVTIFRKQGEIEQELGFDLDEMFDASSTV